MDVVNDIYLYDEYEKDFTHNGMTLKDFEVEPVVKRVINKEFTMTATYSLFGQLANKIKEGMILKAYCPDRTWQLFRIATLEKTLSTIDIYAEHIVYDIRRNHIKNFFENNGSAIKIMAGLQQSLAFTQRFNYSSDITSLHQFTVKNNNPLACLIGSNNGGMNLSSITGGELDFDNFNVKLVKQLGRDRGFRIDFRVNLESIKETVDTLSLSNSLYLEGAVPEGSDYEEDAEPISFGYLEVEGVNDDNRIITSRTNSECQTIEELKAWGQSLFDVDKIHLPKVTHEISIIDLAQTLEYKDFSNLVELQIGDIVHCQISENNVEFDIEERLIEYEWLPRSANYKGLVLGNDFDMYSSTVNDSVNSLIKDLEQQGDIMKDKILNATNQITGQTGGYVTFRPKNKPREILIMDTDNVNTAKYVWRWNLGGLGHSKNGVNGPFETAITADGQIVANFITAGELNANMVRVGFNKIGDTIQMVNNSLIIYNAKNKIMELSKTGLKFTRGNENIGRIGTSGELRVAGVAGSGNYTERAIFIDLDKSGEFIHICPGGTYGLLMYPNGQIDSHGDWIHGGMFHATKISGDNATILGDLKVKTINGKPV